MTTLTTVLGLVPMAIGSAAAPSCGAARAHADRRLSLAPVLTLVVLPVVYVTLDRSDAVRGV
jgi:multidrug efflux pump subunit AcrB